MNKSEKKPFWKTVEFPADRWIKDRPGRPYRIGIQHHDHHLHQTLRHLVHHLYHVPAFEQQAEHHRAHGIQRHKTRSPSIKYTPPTTSSSSP